MLKRFFDIIASALGLIVLSPIIAIVAWQIKRKLGSPVLFRQTRPSKDGKPFEMIKFRTMRDAYDENGNPLPNELRFTPFGNYRDIRLGKEVAWLAKRLGRTIKGFLDDSKTPQAKILLIGF